MRETNLSKELENHQSTKNTKTENDAIGYSAMPLTYNNQICQLLDEELSVGRVALTQTNA